MREVRPEHRYFDLAPRVVPADRSSVVEIRPRFDHCRLDDAVEYEVRYLPAEEFAQRGDWPEHEVRLLRPAGGVLRVEQYFEGEQEHVLLVTRVTGAKRERLGDFRVYSVGPDLLARRPYKGDTHLHSYRSDGRESPAYVAGACRRIGLDFMAVTDHHRYAPSLEAQRAYEGAPIDLRIFPGEEVHPPDSLVHLVNFGGRFSVNDLFADEGAYRRGVAQVDERLGDLPPGVDRYQYASAAWCFERIREAGGLGVFCHPYWFTDWRYSPGGPVTACLLERQPFDAFEVVGGFTYGEFDSNTLQAARYYEERAAGRRLPIVGASDSHGCENPERGLFGWYYTIVFSPGPDLADLVRSVKDLYSVAVEDVPGDRPRPVGPFRLVKYALFLLREVLPEHDELCAEEGRLMLAYAGEAGAEGGNCPVAPGAGEGSPAARDALARLQGRTAAWMDRCWGPRR